MRKVIVANMVSLDGFMAGANGETDWFHVGNEFFEYAKDLLTKVDTILYGRVTYEGMASYWPTVTDENDVMANRINNTPKVVFSTTLENVSWGKWNNTRLVKDAVDEVKKLKQQSGKDMVIYASGGLISSLANHDLIDEYQLVVTPVVLGSGKPAFEGIKQRLNLKLLQTKPFKEGSVLLYYQPERKAG
jgi:dihydrofolate reductase